jgi:hypothetical protein
VALLRHKSAFDVVLWCPLGGVDFALEHRSYSSFSRVLMAKGKVCFIHQFDRDDKIASALFFLMQDTRAQELAVIPILSGAATKSGPINYSCKHASSVSKAAECKDTKTPEERYRECCVRRDESAVR